MTEIAVEFQGISRVLTKSKSAILYLDSTVTYREIIRRLAEMYPDLIGQVINKDLMTFLGSNMLSVNGKRMIRPSDLDCFPQAGEKLILMSILAGG
jgi:hypothetical protein